MAISRLGSHLMCNQVPSPGRVRAGDTSGLATSPRGQTRPAAHSAGPLEAVLGTEAQAGTFRLLRQVQLPTKDSALLSMTPTHAVTGKKTYIWGKM